ncbi:ABC transporter substrate-binding protein [Paenibacillus sediminis]|uniref:Iron complex transport system substrate-binding protein n=1 Tax=Paenibacillus sediminis TaxID=664909 RepID=A0ABS4H4J8_9BACL|nr:ABC transporter substrate-binding protein [Paenibacillus sediminis]MBP1937458.1 iron complex transport system substrate-binding protein [Paenibacillus sediminis]
MHKVSKLWALLCLTLVMSLVIAACGSSAEEKQAPSSQQSTGQSSSQKEDISLLKTVYPLKVTDATGETFTFDKAPKRIVSVSPAETEALFAIGLKDEIVGVSDYDDYPEAVKEKPKMGGIEKPNVEAIIAAEPDIVFTGISMSEESVKKLRDLGIVIFKTNPKTIEDVMNNIQLFGQITDHQQEAKAVVDKMKQQLTQVTEAVKSVPNDEKKKVYIEFAPGWTVGKGEFMDEIIKLAGGVNIASDLQGWSEINEENIIKANPDVILYANGVIDTESKKALDQIIKGRSGWDQINAIQNNQVIGLDQNLLSRPGPRVTEGLIEVAKAIYPDLMNK